MPLSGSVRARGVVYVFVLIALTACAWSLCGRASAREAKDRGAETKKIALPGAVSAPWDLAVTSNAVWVLTPPAAEVQRIDPRTNRVVARVKLPERGCVSWACPDIDRIIGDDRDVWVVNNGAGSLVHIDARRNKVVASVPIKAGVSSAPVFDAGGVWTALDPTSGDIVYVDGRSNEVQKTVHVGVAGAFPVAVVDGVLWAGSAVQLGPGTFGDEVLYRIDPAAATVLATVPGASGAGVVVGDQVWLNRLCCPVVTSVDGHTGLPGQDVDVDGSSAFQVAGGGSVWVRLVNQTGRQWVTRIDTGDGSTTQVELPASQRTGGLGYGHGSMWVTNWDQNAVYRMEVPAR
jgi:hypothetical protein